MGRHYECRGDAVPRSPSPLLVPKAQRADSMALQAQRADSLIVRARRGSFGGWLLCQPFGLFRTQVPADRGSGSHGSQLYRPSGPEQPEMPSGPEQPEMPSGPAQPEALRPSGVFPYR